VNGLQVSEIYLRKAERALLSAKALLDIGDAEGACNRAYYGMFDAARAALICFDHDLLNTMPKTHRGLISAVGQYLVIPKHVSADLGSALNKVERLRLLGDYTGDLINIKGGCPR
jgi:uncharacterized protein (UPF0332 family)